MSSASAGSSLQRSVALVWRTLRSMRTALILLLLLALASVTGSLIPQWPSSSNRVLQYQAAHPLVGEFYQRAGLFDVFGSWWFVLITTLLFTSLVACLVPRTRATWRALRQRPIQAREIDAFRHYTERTVPASPDVALAAARRTLRRRAYRVARDPDRPSLAAEKGAAREVGSLMFHWAFILLLVGVVYGKGTGYSGYARIVEGDTWVDASANYDSVVRSGRFFNDDFTGIGIHLRGFDASYGPTGMPTDFVSHVDLLDPNGNLIRQQDIRVNHPAEVAGLNIFQSAFGWAPVLNVRLNGNAVASQKVVLQQEPAPPGVPADALPWHGFLKVPSVTPQLAVEVELYPDSRAFYEELTTGNPTPMVTEFDPVIRFTVWRGPIDDLSLSPLDGAFTSFMTKTQRGIVGAGQTVSLGTGKTLGPGAPANGLTMSFPDLRQFTVLEITRDRGVPIVLVAAILILIGLLPALYTSRRKVWVRAEASGTGTVLKVGGFALQRKPQFDEEFSKLVEAMMKAAGGGGSPADTGEREKVGSR
jgi:cytochrome c biogenesis protein